MDDSLSNLGTRREFLFGRVARTAKRMEAAAIEGAQSAGNKRRRDAWLLEFTRDAMACRWQVLLNPDSPTDAPEAAVDTLEFLETLEAQLSVYREQSELSRLNQNASSGWVRVEERLFELLQLGVELHRLTAGAFDMTTGPLIRAWGFFRREGVFPSQEALVSALSTVGTQFLELDAAEQAIRFTRPGIEINLGAIGKGHALDRCVERMRGWNLRDFLIHGGQSSVAARGNRSGSETAGGGWRVGLSHPVWPDTRMAEFELHNEALGTSGTGRQFFYHQGQRYGHIIDPRTGLPSQEILSATVIAPEAALADALATACYVLGVERSCELIASNPSWRMLLVVPTESRERVKLVTINLPDDRWTLLED